MAGVETSCESAAEVGRAARLDRKVLGEGRNAAEGGGGRHLRQGLECVRIEFDNGIQRRIHGRDGPFDAPAELLRCDLAFRQ